ncbi:hypothetical protein ACOYR1_09555 [Thalassotalea piscium]
MNASNPSEQNDEFTFQLEKMNEHASSKRFRDRNNQKRQTNKVVKKQSRNHLFDDNEYYDEWK